MYWEFFHLDKCIKLGIVYCIIQGVTDYNFQINSSFSLKIVFILANSVDHDEMLHYAAFYLGVHCLQLEIMQIIYAFIPLLVIAWVVNLGTTTKLC